MKERLMTNSGLKALKDELEFLKTTRRKEVSEKIKVALSFGDLSENSEYDAAKNDQAMVEGRISQIEKMLANVRVIDESELTTDRAMVGCTVKLRDIEFDEIEEYAIVSTNEADPANGKISDESPVGHAVLEHSVGDHISVTLPTGAVAHYELLEIGKQSFN